MMIMLAAAVRAVFSKHGEQQTETVAAEERNGSTDFFPPLNLVREISFYKMLCHGVFFFLSLSWETDSQNAGGKGRVGEADDDER